MGAYTRRDRAGIAEDLKRVLDLFPRLAERRKQAGGTLSGGEQQMLAIGRALMARPRLLLLDEPSMGLAPMLIQQIFEIITEINEQGTTILLVEQNAQQALSRAHRAYVLETGRIVKEGTGAGPAARPGGQGGVPRRGLRHPSAWSEAHICRREYVMFTPHNRWRAALGVAGAAMLTLSLAACGDEGEHRPAGRRTLRDGGGRRGARREGPGRDQGRRCDQGRHRLDVRPGGVPRRRRQDGRSASTSSCSTRSSPEARPQGASTSRRRSTRSSPASTPASTRSVSRRSPSTPSG